MRGGCARVWALPALHLSSFWALVSLACLPSAPFAVLSLLLSSAFPLPLFFAFFVGDCGCLRAVLGGVGGGGVCGSGWPLVFAALGVGMGACWCCCWRGRHGAVGRLWRRGLGHECRGGWWFGGPCASGSLCVCRLPDIWWLLDTGAPVRGCWRWAAGGSGSVAPV